MTTPPISTAEETLWIFWFINTSPQYFQIGTQKQNKFSIPLYFYTYICFLSSCLPTSICHQIQTNILLQSKQHVTAHSCTNIICQLELLNFQTYFRVEVKWSCLKKKASLWNGIPQGNSSDDSDERGNNLWQKKKTHGSVFLCYSCTEYSPSASIIW